MWYQLIALMLWASSFIAAKFAYEMFDPVLMVQVRLTIVAIFLLPACLRLWKSVEKPMRAQLWWLAFFNYTAVFLLQFIGLKYTSAASGITMIGLEPLMVVFVGHFFFKDRAQWFHWLFGAFAFIGVYLLIAGGKNSGEISVLGCLLILTAGLVFAAVLRWTQQVVGTVSAKTYTNVSIVLGALTTLPFTLILTQNWTIHFSWSGLGGLLYLAIGCSWIAFWLWNKGLNRVNANLSGIMTALEPVFGVFLAVVILNEHISAESWIGIFIIIASTLGATLMPKLLSATSQKDLKNDNI